MKYSHNDFLIAVLRFAFGGHTSLLIQECAKNIDWESVVKIAYEHGVAALLCDQLLKFDKAIVPEEILFAADRFLTRQREMNQHISDQLIAIQQHLEKSQVNIIPFKGPTLAAESYPDLALRQFGDLDFLIRIDRVDDCITALNEMGYVHEWSLTPRQWQEFVFYAGEDILFDQHSDRVPIEPHWAFAPSVLALNVDYQTIWKDARQISFHETKVDQLSVEDEFILLCLHGCKSQWEKLKWVVDIVAFVDTHNDIKWDRVFAKTSKQGHQRMVRLSLGLAVRLLLLKLPDPVSEWLKEDPFAAQWSKQLANDFFSQREIDSIWTFSTFYWNMRERWWDRWRYAFFVLTQPRVQHFMDIGIPDKLFWLYWPYRLAHDYIALPVWIVFKSLRKQWQGH